MYNKIDLRRYKYRILYVFVAVCDLTLFAIFLFFLMNVVRATDTAFVVIVVFAAILLIVNIVTIVLGYRHAKRKITYMTPG